MATRKELFEVIRAQENALRYLRILTTEGAIWRDRSEGQAEHIKRLEMEVELMRLLLPEIAERMDLMPILITEDTAQVDIRTFSKNKTLFS